MKSVATRSKKDQPEDNDSKRNQYDKMEQKLDDINRKMSEFITIKNEFMELKNSIIFLSEKYDEINRDLHTYKTESNNNNKTIQGLLEKNLDKDKQIKSLNDQITQLEQYSRNQNIEIHGIPIQEGENCKQIVKCIAQELQVDIKTEEIDVAHRTYNKKPNSIPSIVARFTTRTKRDSIIAKKYLIITNRNVPAVEIGKKVYISEHLTSQNKNLLRLTKMKAKEVNYKYVWFKNNKLLVREKDNSLVIRINSEDDINNKM